MQIFAGDPNETMGDQALTCLHRCFLHLTPAQTEKGGVVQYLLKNGASANAINSEGKTPLL